MPHLSERHKLEALSIIELCLDSNSIIEFENILHRTKILMEYEMIACGVGVRDDYSMKIISSLNDGFPAEFMETVIDHDGHGISPLFLRWLETQIPQVLDIQQSSHQFTTEQIAFYQKFNLQNIMSHGVLDCGQHCASYFGFANMANGIQPHHICLITMLVPHLHQAYVKIPEVKQKLSLLIAKQLKIKQSKNNQGTTLSHREMEVLQLVFIGKTNREISNTLCLSASTIKNHVQKIIQKLDAKNRQHATAKALQLGIIELI